MLKCSECSEVGNDRICMIATPRGRELVVLRSSVIRAHTCVYTSAFVHILVCILLHSCTYLCVYFCIRAHICVYISAFVGILVCVPLHSCTHLCAYFCIRGHTCVHTSAFVLILVCILLHSCAYLCVYFCICAQLQARLVGSC